MPPVSFLDEMVNRFRHRWEIDRQFRAAASGVVGLLVLVALCSCAGIASNVANSVLASSGFGGSGGGGGGGPQSQGTTTLKGFAGIPTDTVPAWTPGTLPPAPPAPTSATAAPSPTHVPTETPVPTATPCQSNCGGGLPTTCNGHVGRNTWAFDKCPELAGQGGSLTVSIPGWANTPINIIVSFGSCANGANCTVLFTPDANHLDGQGNITVSFTVPAAAANNSAPMSGLIQVSNGGPSFSYQAAPVQ